MGTSLSFQVLFPALGVGLPLMMLCGEGVHVRRQPGA